MKATFQPYDKLKLMCFRIQFLN